MRLSFCMCLLYCSYFALPLKSLFVVFSFFSIFLIPLFCMVISFFIDFFCFNCYGHPHVLPFSLTHRSPVLFRQALTLQVYLLLCLLFSFFVYCYLLLSSSCSLALFSSFFLCSFFSFLFLSILRPLLSSRFPFTSLFFYHLPLFSGTRLPPMPPSAWLSPV